MVAKRYNEKHRVVFYETDVTKNINIGMLVDLMMLASENQSEQLGIGTDKVNGLGYGWVITQHVLEIERLPKINEEVKIWTEADSYNKGEPHNPSHHRNACLLIDGKYLPEYQYPLLFLPENRAYARNRSDNQVADSEN